MLTTARAADDVGLLTGPGGRELVGAVLAAEGLVVRGCDVHAVHHRPGVGVSVGYAVRWAAPATARGGEEYLVASTAPLPVDVAAAPGCTTAVVDGRPVTVWRFPADPALPGLAAATSPAAVAAMLGTAPRDVALELVTYRPLRRAVVRVRTPGRTAYLKVVRPHTAADLVRRHAVLLDAGLPAAPAHLAAPGVVVLDGLPGEPLAAALARDGAADVDPTLVLDLLRALPAEAVRLPRRASWAERLEDHASAAAVAVPWRAAEIARLSDALAEILARTDAGPVVATHGDLHEANLLVGDGALVGLLDVDSLGPGHRVDDLACLLGHLSVLPTLAPGTYRHVRDALQRWLAAVDDAASELRVDPVGLRARAGAVVLSLVAGSAGGGPEADDGASRRLDVVGTWLAEARLRDLSSPRPRPLTNGDEARWYRAGELGPTTHGTTRHHTTRHHTTGHHTTRHHTNVEDT